MLSVWTRLQNTSRNGAAWSRRGSTVMLSMTVEPLSATHPIPYTLYPIPHTLRRVPPGVPGSRGRGSQPSATYDTADTLYSRLILYIYNSRLILYIDTLYLYSRLILYTAVCYFSAVCYLEMKTEEGHTSRHGAAWSGRGSTVMLSTGACPGVGCGV